MAKKKPTAPAPVAGAFTRERPAAPAPVAGAFTVRELAAAKRLILLSGSSTSSSLGARSGAVAAASSGSSVNAPQAVPPRPPAEDYLSDEELEDESQEVPGIQRRTRLYRLVSEIYQVTEPMEEEPADDESGRKETATKTKK
uniref:Uncharacterized protein n=1 Tax=Oryza brachyantha TaxID=4533 RepID=J3MZN5_ORYBR